MVQKLGLEEVLKLVAEERIANKVKTYAIDLNTVPTPFYPFTQDYPDVIIENKNHLKISKDVDLGSSNWLTIKRHNSSDNNTIEAINHLKKLTSITQNVMLKLRLLRDIG